MSALEVHKIAERHALIQADPLDHKGLLGLHAGALICRISAMDWKSERNYANLFKIPAKQYCFIVDPISYDRDILPYWNQLILAAQQRGLKHWGWLVWDQSFYDTRDLPTSHSTTIEHSFILCFSYTGYGYRTNLRIGSMVRAVGASQLYKYLLSILIARRFLVLEPYAKDPTLLNACRLNGYDWMGINEDAYSNQRFLEVIDFRKEASPRD